MTDKVKNDKKKKLPKKAENMEKKRPKVKDIDQVKDWKKSLRDKHIIIKDVNKKTDLEKAKKLIFQNNSVYMFYGKHCPFCVKIEEEWGRAVYECDDVNVFEIEREMFEYTPMHVKQIVDFVPMIVGFNKDKMIVFDKDRTKSNFVKFMNNVKK